MRRGQIYYLIILICHLTMAYWAYTDFSWSLLGFSFLVYYTVGKIGSDIGYHRYYCHNAFKTNTFWEYVMLYSGLLFGSGSTIDWLVIHSYHHHIIDDGISEENPKDTGWFRGYFDLYNRDVNMVGKFNVKLIARALKDPKQVFVHKYCLHINAVYVLLVLCLGWVINQPWLIIPLWVGPRVILFNLSATTNTICHKWGYQTYTDKGGDSRNNIWINFIVLGTAMHNNHHALPKKLDQSGEKWYEFDLLAVFVKRFMEKK